MINPTSIQSMFKDVHRGAHFRLSSLSLLTSRSCQWAQTLDSKYFIRIFFKGKQRQPANDSGENKHDQNISDPSIPKHRPQMSTIISYHTYTSIPLYLYTSIPPYLYNSIPLLYYTSIPLIPLYLYTSLSLFLPIYIYIHIYVYTHPYFCLNISVHFPQKHLSNSNHQFLPIFDIPQAMPTLRQCEHAVAAWI